MTAINASRLGRGHGASPLLCVASAPFFQTQLTDDDALTFSPGLGRARTRALPSSNMAEEEEAAVSVGPRGLSHTCFSFYSPFVFLLFLQALSVFIFSRGQVAAMFAQRDGVCVCVLAGVRAVS